MSWDAALDDIALRLRAIWDQHGGAGLGHYLGNPPGFSYSAPVWSGLWCSRLDVVHQFTVGSQDVNSRFVASKLLYDAASQLPFPDLPRTDFLFMLGANPHVSHGSVIKAPRIKEELKAIVERGGRVVVVDPRLTETARAHEHVAVRPDGDAWLLLSMLHVLFEEDLVDRAAVAEQTTGVEWLGQAVRDFKPEVTEIESGVAPDVVRDLARDFAAAPTAAAYGRTGACLGRHGTLVNYLLDALSIVTGNLDRPGGMLFAHGVIPLEDLAERAGRMTYGAKRSRVGDFPDIMGIFPASIMAEEITTPGPGRLRAMLITGGNPVLSTPDGAKLSAALDELDLLVSLDLYVTETSKLAHYILPTTTFLEREDLPNVLTSTAITPFFQATEAVVEPYGEARQEWEIFERAPPPHGTRGQRPRHRSAQPRSARRGEVGARPHHAAAHVRPARPHRPLRRPFRVAPRRPLGRTLHARAPPRRRPGRVRCHRSPRARCAAPGPPGAARPSRDRRRAGAAGVSSPGRRRLPDPDDRPARDAFAELVDAQQRDVDEGRRPHVHAARINPDDAASAGLVDGGEVRIVSASASIVTRARITDEVGRGTIAVPHGWGHRGGWNLANAVRRSQREPADVQRG